MDMHDMGHDTSGPVTTGIITEYPLNWPGTIKGSTHELIIDEEHIFVSGQKMGYVAKLDYQGNVLNHFKMPGDSWPHGILLDKHNRLWLSLEDFGLVVRLDKKTGEIEQEIDVKIHAAGAAKPINTAPHGIGLDADGETIWFTGKRTSTLGKINPDGSVEHFQLPTYGAIPIFLAAGPDKGIWGTELQGNNILHRSVDGALKEYNIKSNNPWPIGIVQDPVTHDAMWFTQPNTMQIGRITMDGKITQIGIPALRLTDYLGSLVFDRENNLWVQVYVSDSDTTGSGFDYLVKYHHDSLFAPAGKTVPLNYTIYPLPRRQSMLHRIKVDYNGNIWFTEMMSDRIGKVTLFK